MNIAKIHNGLMGVLAFYVIGFSAFYGYVNFIDVPSLSYTNLPFRPVSETIVAGQIVPITVSRCNSSNETIVYATTRNIENMENNAAQTLPVDSSILNPGCVTTVSYANRTPDNLPSGKYRLYGSAVLPGKYTKDHSIVWYSSPFDVIAPK